MTAGLAPIVGTAGWNLPRQEWGRFPATGTHLGRYGTRLNGVEINSSFYRPHRRDTYARWAASVPDHFRFAVKVPKTMTHERRLAACEALLDRFAAEVEGLGHKRGPLLVQLPPSFAFEETAAGSFFAALQARITGPVVCEPRHASWFGAEAGSVLNRYGVAQVAADPAPGPGAGEPGGFGGLVYFRLHGSPRIYASNYEAEALASIGERLAHYARRNIPVWCIFDNTAQGHALGNAMAIAAALDEPPPRDQPSSVHSGW